MQVSKKKLNQTIKNQIEQIFYQVIVDTESTQQAEVVFNSLLSNTERQAVVKRLAIAIFLDKGRSYDNIKKTLKVSSATIASVNAQMGDPGIQLALRKVKAERWAEDWTEKITTTLGKVFSSK